MRRIWIVGGLTVAVLGALTAPSAGTDKPISTQGVFLKIGPHPAEMELGTGSGNTDPGGPYSKKQIERFRCESGGNPEATVDISCNTTEYNQHWNPDNELAIAVDPEDPDHLLAGSNDYFYRFNNATGARQAIVPTGFFTSFDGGETWIDGQIPLLSGNGGGDPAPAFDAKHDVAVMAQLENAGGLSGFFVTQGDVSVSRSTDGGVTWSKPVTAFMGQGGLNPAKNAVFWDKEFIAVNNYPGTESYGRIVVTATKFRFDNFVYVSSAIGLSYSDDGGRTWSDPVIISGSHPNCTFQNDGSGGTECDENQFSYPEFGPDGTLYVHFHNYQHQAAEEVPFEADAQIMVVKAADTSGAPQFSGPTFVVDIEDGLADTPYSVIFRQTVWGHQIRWSAAGTISANPTDPDNVVIVYADRGSPNPNATPGCFFTTPGEPPDYDPCDAGPGSNTNVYMAESTDGGETWTGRILLDGGPTQQWFPWADHAPLGAPNAGELHVAWDEDTEPSEPEAPGQQPANDEFVHVLWSDTGGREVLAPTTGDNPAELVDISVTHWAGQYVPEEEWPRVCGPEGYADDGVPDAEGKDCNVFHGDYTGLAVDTLGRAHVVWTGLNRLETSNQLDPYTGDFHDGYVQDAMYARR